jgi:hypothetical protein
MKANKTKIVGGALIAVGVGVAGYFGYKLYKSFQAKKDPTVGALTDGYPDHNAKIATAYWRRQRELYVEQQRLRAMGM